MRVAIDRQLVVWLLAAFSSTSVLVADAQPLTQLPQVGYLGVGNENAPMVKTVVAEFKAELRDLGWVDGKHVKFVLRYASGQIDKLSELAVELVHLKVNVIVTAPGTEPALAAKRATASIPLSSWQLLTP